MTAEKALDYVEKNLSKTLEDLKTSVKIPSVSLEGFDPKQLNSSAECIAERCKSVGLENVELIQFGDVHPYVFAEWNHQKDAPTLLLYAHHDVQPPGREEKWKSNPFQPTERDGRLYGRGTADDKAGIFAHLAAIDAFMKTAGQLPVNVKVLIEGEEEIGSEHLAEFVKRNKTKLHADGMILTDCANIDTGIPSITTSLRGMVAVDVEVETLSHPVHSGLWGGILPDPVVTLSKILATLTDHQGNILIDGIYDDVKPPSDIELKSYKSIKMENVARSATGLARNLPFTVKESQFAEYLWRQPALSVNAIQSGSRKLVSNIIQDGAWARVSIRIVQNMNPDKVLKQLTEHLQKQCPSTCKVKITPERNSQWWAIDDVSSDVYQIAAKALEKGYRQPTQFIGCGASIPFVQPLSEELGGIPAILVGVEDPFTNAHSENESLHLGDFRKAILGQVHMLSDLARWKRMSVR